MSQPINVEFDEFSFTAYMQRIGGNLYESNFYRPLYEAWGDKSIVDRMLGVSNPEDPSTTILDPNLFYANWSTKNSSIEYAQSVRTQLFNSADITNQLSLLRLMSAFIIQYYFFVKKDIDSVLPRIVDVNEPGYYIQTTNLYLFFKSIDVRGAGNKTIESMCKVNYSFVQGDESKRIYISKNPSLLGWCGCFAPPDPISEIAKVDLPRECDPMCVGQTSIKLWSEQGNEISCNSAVCVISGISLNVQDSTSRNYNFSQICSACEENSSTDQPCRCVIDSDFSSLLTKIGAIGEDGKQSGMDVSTTFSRYCPNAICVITDYTQEGTRTLPCNTLNPSATGTGSENYATGDITYDFEVSVQSGTFGLIILFVIVPLIFLCFIAIVKSSQEIVVNNKRPPPGKGSRYVERVGIN